MKNILILAALLSTVIYACNNEVTNNGNATDNTVNVDNQKFNSVPPDTFTYTQAILLPEDANQVTAAGLGVIWIGDSIENVKKLFNKAKKENSEWPTYKVQITGNEYILVETSAENKHLIKRISTNAKNYITLMGLQVGMNAKTAIRAIDSKAFVYREGSEVLLRFPSEGISAKLDANTQKKLTNNEIINLADLPEDAVIVEIIVL